jgi:hypothetical protein
VTCGDFGEAMFEFITDGVVKGEKKRIKAGQKDPDKKLHLISCLI